MRSTLIWKLRILLVLAVAWQLGANARAQTNPGTSVFSGAGFTACPSSFSLLEVKGNPPRPAAGAGSVADFVESLTSNDAAIEITVGQGRILTTKVSLSVPGRPPATVAVGDPTVLDLVVLNSKQIRLIGNRIGVTDLSVTTPDGQVFSFEVRILADLNSLRGVLARVYPDTSVRVSQIRDHLVAEGQVRDTAQANRVLETIRVYLASVQASQARQIQGQDRTRAQPKDGPQPKGPDEEPVAVGGDPSIRSTRSVIVPAQVINLLQVPGPKQVLLKVKVAEINRTGFRQIGADILAVTPSGTILGTQLGSATATTGANATAGGLQGFADLLNTGNTTAFGLFNNARLAIFVDALRRNALLKVLAEPNLVALDGHSANFLAGGEFPVPVPQTSGGIGTSPTITVQFKEFGVRLGFLPFIIDGDTIRLQVDPEVSNIDRALSTTLVVGGSPVPGLNVRRAHTVVEMKEGQTLAIAGLLQVTLDGTTSRLPVLGDLPVLGPFFSNTTSQRIEKELLVLVTPYLVEASCASDALPLPGDDVKAPNDLEFFLLNRIEGRTGQDFRATTNYDNRLIHLRRMLRLESETVVGPHGYSR